MYKMMAPIIGNYSPISAKGGRRSRTRKNRTRKHKRSNTHSKNRRTRRNH
jgi:hypothetical protein